MSEPQSASGAKVVGDVGAAQPGQEHVAPVEGLVVNPGALWQPTTGTETLRLLEDSFEDDDDAQQRTERQASAVLARCIPPKDRDHDPVTGLVVGYVQSGKTLSFTTVTTLARDNGFPLVILFAGTKDNLHKQTAARLARDLAVERKGGMSPWMLVSNPKKAAGDAQAIGKQLQLTLNPTTPEKFRRTVVITVMKNPTRLNQLRNLLTGLAEFGVNLHEIPVLVIDDEADQAGLNALAADDDVTSTYAAIVALRDVLPHHSYLMYTATPQAPLLVNLADTLSPDFVAVLEPGEGYTGGRYFFEEHGKTFVEEIGAAEAVRALDPKSIEPPESLQRALATYLVGVAALGDGPLSMLVHPSQTQALHGRYEKWVLALTQTWSEVLQDPGPDRDELIEELIKPAYDDLATTSPTLPPLDELLRELPFWIAATRVKVVNSGTSADGEIDWNAAPSWILIGGNKLDRGFTVEGLSVTYMPRSPGVGNVDSIQQRARFFGYKGAYAQLCRAWVATRTADAFRGYVDHEKVLRAELQKVASTSMSLKRWKRLMLLDPSMRPCRKGVIDLDYVHTVVRPDRWLSLDHLLIDDADHEDNRSIVETIQGRGLEPPAPDERDKRPEDQQLRFAIRLSDLVERLADWRTSLVDRSSLNQLLLLLQTRLDDAPDLTADVYLMRGLLPRDRTLNGTNGMNLFEGRRPSGDRYQGDAAFFSEGRVSLQIYSVNVEEPSGKVRHTGAPALAFRVPRELAGGVLIQAETGD